MLGPMMSALQALRAATGAIHARMHQEPRFAALASGLIDLPRYRGLLERLYGFHAPLEDRLFGALEGETYSFRPTRRVDLLRCDLGDAGLDPAAVGRLPQAAADGLPVLDSIGAVLGCLYVREGSTLGGKLLARALDPLLGASGATGRRFLAGAADGAASWRACCAAVEAAGADGHLPEMVRGACETFSALERWLGGDTGLIGRITPARS